MTCVLCELIRLICPSRIKVKSNAMDQVPIVIKSILNVFAVDGATISEIRGDWRIHLPLITFFIIFTKFGCFQFVPAEYRQNEGMPLASSDHEANQILKQIPDIYCENYRWFNGSKDSAHNRKLVIEQRQSKRPRHGFHMSRGISRNRFGFPIGDLPKINSNDINVFRLAARPMLRRV